MPIILQQIMSTLRTIVMQSDEYLHCNPLKIIFSGKVLRLTWNSLRTQLHLLKKSVVPDSNKFLHLVTCH